MRTRILYCITALALILGLILPMAVPVMAQAIEGHKNRDPDEEPYNVGETIHYVMTVTNPVGNMAVNNLTRIWDTLPDGTVIEFLYPGSPYGNDGGGSLLVQNPGDSAQFNLTYIVDMDDFEWIVPPVGEPYWGVRNTFQAEGVDSDMFPVEILAEDIAEVIQSTIDIEKYVWDGATWRDADTPPGPCIIIGSDVTWKYIVTNNGNIGLTNVVVTDTELGLIDTISYLPVGSTWTLYASGTAVLGQYANVATVWGTPPVGGPVSDTDPCYYFGVGLMVTITISATEPIIPRESRVENGHVLYESTLTITARNTITQAPVAGLSIQVQSDRPQDTIIQPTEPTNDRGVTKARIQTREKGTATITGTTSDISVAPVPTTIEFNNANYESQFLVTVYIIADENDFSGPTVTDPCGLTGTYYRRFLYSRTGVLMQGAGRTRDGAYIQIDWMAGGPRGANTCFRVVPFPTTAYGEPLQEGITIAVDPEIIPLGSEVYIEGVGTRTAQDTGRGIQGYHIDLYVGVGQAASSGWANTRLSVRYLDP